MNEATRTASPGVVAASRRRQVGQQGQSIVELAAVVPAAVLVLMSVLYLGRVFTAQHVITNAAREGARIAAIGDSTDSEIEDKVGGFIRNGKLDPNLALITVTGASANSGRPTSVSIAYPLGLGPLRFIMPRDSVMLRSRSDVIHE